MKHFAFCKILQSYLVKSNIRTIFLSAGNKSVEPYSSGDSSSESDSEQEKANVNNVKQRILEASLHHVPKLGWSRDALAAGAIDAGFSSCIQGIFVNGPSELVFHFNTKSNLKLQQILIEKSTAKNLTRPIFFFESIQERIKMIVPFVKNWSQALFLMSYPSNIPQSYQIFSIMIDDISFYSGDRSTDISWYSNRASIQVLYKSTELFLLQDSSYEFDETWKFLKRNIDLGAALQEINLSQICNSGYHMVRNVLNMNSLKR